MTDALMTAEHPMSGSPVVLIVEDRADLRMDRVQDLVDRGCVPIPVASTDAAARELTASPGIDLVLADIHLVPRNENDKSGVELARFVKTDHPDIPVVGYSAYFVAGELPAEDLALFDYQYSKGQSTFKEMEKILDRCAEMALESRLRRKEATDARLAEAELEPTNAVLEVLRSATLADVEGVEQVLHDAGFRLKLVKVPGASNPEPLIVWIRHRDDYVDVEVYGHSALYVSASTEKEALEQLVDLLGLYWEELDARRAELSGPAQRLHRFLGDLGLPGPSNDTR